MRFYGADPTMDTHEFTARVWGGVPPPKVEYEEADGRWVEVRHWCCCWVDTWLENVADRFRRYAPRNGRETGAAVHDRAARLPRTGKR